MQPKTPSPKRWYIAVPLAAIMVLAGLMVVPGATRAGAGPLLAASDADPVAKVEESYAKLPISFAANQGQADPQVKFLAGGHGYGLALTPTEAVLTLNTSPPLTERPRPIRATQAGENAAGAVVRMRFEGANPDAAVVGRERLPGVANYLLGSDPSQWHTDVPTYAKVAYRQVYPGVDVVWYGHEGQLEHDFIVAPGADPALIKVAFEGAEHLSVEGDTVEVHLANGQTLTERIPRIYQTVDGTRRSVGGEFRLVSPNQVGFQLATYDDNHPLVIDPVLEYSTYLGSSGGGGGDDFGVGVAVDGTGHAYVAGPTVSSNFPTQNPFQATNPGAAVFVAKVNPTGTTVAYSTYLGGTGFIAPFVGVAVDATGHAYVTGTTSSTDFPTQHPFQADLAGDIDVFVTKLEPAGDSLAYSTYLGGTSSDVASSIAVDGTGHAYVTGTTSSTDFPTQHPFQADLAGGADVFVTKLDPAGDTLAYSTYLGGSSTDEAPTFGGGIGVDATGHAYVTGHTDSSAFPTQNPFQPANAGGTDVFVTKLDPDGSGLVYSTYLGGADSDRATGVAVDDSGHAYVAGDTASVDFPTQNPFQASLAGFFTDVFVTKLNPAGDSLAYSTYLGGTSDQFAAGVAVDGAGHAYVAGTTNSTDFPTQTPFQGSNAGPPGSQDVFVTKLNPAGDSLAYSTYLGGAGQDIAFGVAVDGTGHAYVTGDTRSTDFPILNAFQASNAGTSDAFVTRISAAGDTLVYSTYLGGSSGDDFGLDGVQGFAVDTDGSAYVASPTSSGNFPTQNPVQAYGGSFDVVVAKLNPTGDSLAYSTYLGGTFLDVVGALAVDEAGSAYVTGQTLSVDFPTQNPFQAANAGGREVFVAKLSPAGNTLVYSTYLGGSANEDVAGLAVDGAGNAYVAGVTLSADFPTHNPFRATPDNSFVTKFNAAGDSVAYSTYFNGLSHGLAVDQTGHAYLTGTTSGDLPTENPFQATPAGFDDVFVTKFHPTGTSLVYSTYLGGTGSDAPTFGGIAVDATGHAYVTGRTDSSAFPTQNPFQSANAGGDDMFVTKFNPAGNTLDYSTYLGGTDFDEAAGVAFDMAGNAYVAGNTDSTDFPTEHPFQPTNAGDRDVIVAKLDSAGATLLYSTYLGGSGLDIAGGVAVDAAGNTYVAGNTDSTDFPTQNPLQATNAGYVDLFVTKIARQVGVSVSIADNPDPVAVGDGLTYTVAVANHGPEPASAGSLEVALPVQPIAVSDPLCGVVDAAISCNVPPLAAGETYHLQTTVVPTETGTIVASAELIFTVPEDDPSDNAATEQTRVVPPTPPPLADAPDLPPGLQLEGSGPLTSITGELDSENDIDLYRICVTGDTFSATTVGGASFDTQLFLFTDDAVGVAANDDEFFTTQSHIGGPTFTNGDPLIFTPGAHLLAITSNNNDPLDENLNPIFPDDFAALVAPVPGAGHLFGWSNAGFSSGSYTIALTGATFVGEAPCLEADLEVTKTDDEPVAVGETLTYTVTVTNHGPSDATDVVLVDPLPDGVTFLSATPSQGSCQTTTCLLGSVADGATATVTITVRADVAGTITNTATVAATEPDPVPENNTATETTTITAADDDGGYDDDPGDPGFGFDTPFDDAGETDQPRPSPTATDPTIAGVLGATGTSGGGDQAPARVGIGDVAGQPAVGPVAIGELPRTGFDPLPIGLAAALVLGGQILRVVSRRRRTQES